MNALGREMSRAVRVDWNASRMQAAEAGMHTRRRKRAVVRGAIVGTLAVVVVIVALYRRDEAVATKPAVVAPVVVTPQQRSDVATKPAVEVPANVETAVPAEAIAVEDKNEVVIAPSPTPPKPIAKRAKPLSKPAETATEMAGSREQQPIAIEVVEEQPIDHIDALLRAADAKRASGRTDEAVELLRTIIRDHANDSRAPLAAFTLGRVLLERKRSGEAAAAFATAERLAPKGPLAQDAIARQTEALWLAGDKAGAKRAAHTYVERWPQGRKIKSVRAWGGL